MDLLELPERAMDKRLSAETRIYGHYEYQIHVMDNISER